MPYLPLTLLGGLLAWDGTSLGQTMVSRPIVAATLAGWVLGDATSGLVLGGVLELLYLPVVPVGGARFPEVGPAAVVGAATAAAAGWGPGIALGCLVALAWSQLGGASIVLLRRANERTAPDPYTPPILPGQIERAHLTAMGLDLLRGTGLTALGILVGVHAVAPAAAVWPLQWEATLALLLVVTAIPAGALLRSLGGTRRRGVLLAIGAGVGLAGGLFL